MHKNLMDPIKLDLKKKISRFFPQKRNRISTLESKSVLRNSNIFIGIFPFPPKNITNWNRYMNMIQIF